MTREVNDKNQIWFENDGNVTKIGFTQNFIDTALNQCWHILPGNRSKITKKSPLFVVETNDGMVTIMSPINGYYRDFIGAKAQDFPDQITAADVILSLSDQREDAPRAREVDAVGGLMDDIRQEQARLRAEFNARAGRAQPRADGGFRIFNDGVPAPRRAILDDPEF